MTVDLIDLKYYNPISHLACLKISDTLKEFMNFEKFTILCQQQGLPFRIEIAEDYYSGC